MAGAGVGDGVPVGAGEGNAPLVAWAAGEEAAKGAGVLSVHRAVAGHVAGGLRPAEPGGQGHSQVHAAAQHPRSGGGIRKGHRKPWASGRIAAREAGGGRAGGGRAGGGDEGGGGLAGQQVQVGPGAQDVQGAGLPGGFHRLGQRGQVLVCGQHPRWGQVAAGQGGGAGGLGEHLHPGVFQRLFLAAPGGFRVRGQDRAADQGAQLPARQVRGPADDELLDRRGVLIIQLRHFLGDHFGAPLVDQAGGQCGAGQRQTVQAEGEVQQPGGAAPGQRQRDGDLVIHVVKRPPVPRLPARLLAAGGQTGHRRHPDRRRPRGQPVRGLQCAGQLIVIQLAQVIALDEIDQRGQDRAGLQGVRPAAVCERGALI